MKLLRDYIAPNKKRAAIVAITVIVACSGALFYLRHSRSPEGLLPHVLHAIQTADAQALWQMADPDEIARLNLTEPAVEAFIQGFRHRNNPSREFVLDRLNTRADEAVWLLRFPGDPIETVRGGVLFVDDGKIGWRLNLSGTLYGLCPGQNRRNWEK